MRVPQNGNPDQRAIAVLGLYQPDIFIVKTEEVSGEAEEVSGESQRYTNDKTAANRTVYEH